MGVGAPPTGSPLASKRTAQEFPPRDARITLTMGHFARHRSPERRAVWRKAERSEPKRSSGIDGFSRKGRLENGLASQKKAEKDSGSVGEVCGPGPLARQEARFSDAESTPQKPELKRPVPGTKKMLVFCHRQNRPVRSRFQLTGYQSELHPKLHGKTCRKHHSKLHGRTQDVIQAP